MKIVHSYIANGALHRFDGVEVEAVTQFPSKSKHNLILSIGEPWDDLKVSVLDYLDIPHGDNPIETYDRMVCKSSGAQILIPLHGRRASIGLTGSTEAGEVRYSKLLKLERAEIDAIAAKFLSLSQEETGLTPRAYAEYRKWFEAGGHNILASA